MWDGFTLIQPHYLEAIADGRLTFGFSIGLAGMVVSALVLVALAVAFYWRTTKPVGRGWKTFFISLRAATLLVLGFCLLQPGVLISEVNPQETYVAVLVDDSQSMSISDTAGNASRSEQALDLLYQKQQVVNRLGENFQVRTYKFSDMARRVVGPQDFESTGTRSAIGAGIEYVMGELSSFPLAGVVLVSDGADNGEDDPQQAVRSLIEKQVPLYTVGMGSETIDKDVHIVSVNAAKSLLEGSIYAVEVTVGQQGFKDQRAQLQIKTGDDVVTSKTINLADDGTAKRYTLELTPDAEEILVYDISVEEKAGETILQNNHHRFFIDNRKKPPLDILYVEGQPRNEYKFARRALQNDDSLRLVTYLQTGPRKFLRQGIESPQELSDGFPKTARKLYQYEALMFGNVERSFFNESQLELINEFVAKRGGGFMLLGGLQESFIDSPVDDFLPVELVRESRLPSYLQGGARRGDHPTGAEFRPHLTKQGQYSPLLRLSSNDSENRDRWRQMPNLQGVYVTGRPKPGASVLMEHSDLTYKNQPLPVLTTQRYGAGRSMVLATASSWRWQMMMPHEDQSHERIWRQMLRWLATESQQRLTLKLDQDNYAVGDQVEVSAQLLDPQFEPDNDGLLWLEVTDPAGETREFPMDWQLEKEGTYTRTLNVEQEGVYDLAVNVPSEASGELQAQSPLIVTPPRREYMQAGMDGGLLKRLAATTGGRFYSREDASRLVDDITYSPNAYSQEKVHSLWDQPLFLYLLIALICVEWAGRRYKGLS